MDGDNFELQNQCMIVGCCSLCKWSFSFLSIPAGNSKSCTCFLFVYFPQNSMCKWFWWKSCSSLWPRNMVDPISSSCLPLCTVYNYG